MSRIWIILTILLIFCGILFISTSCNLISPSSTPATTAPQTTSGTQSPPVNSQPGNSSIPSNTMVSLPSFSSLITSVEKSVVKIDVNVPATTIFGQVIQQQGAGSGWITSSDGIIMTANHVVEGASSITVTTLDGKTYPAQTLTGNSNVDIAILKINATNLPALKPADVSKIKTGDWVLAIGNPLGQGIIATQGIISRMGVDVPVSSSQTYHNMIETTAAINPGNSGGALIDLNGEVIGVTSLKVSAAGIEGMGYAINIADALPLLQNISR